MLWLEPKTDASLFFFQALLLTKKPKGRGDGGFLLGFRASRDEAAAGIHAIPNWRAPPAWGWKWEWEWRWRRNVGSCIYLLSEQLWLTYSALPIRRNPLLILFVLHWDSIINFSYQEWSKIAARTQTRASQLLLTSAPFLFFFLSRWYFFLGSFQAWVPQTLSPRCSLTSAKILHSAAGAKRGWEHPEPHTGPFWGCSGARWVFFSLHCAPCGMGRCSQQGILWLSFPSSVGNAF